MESINFEQEKKKFGQHVRRLRQKLESTDYDGRSVSQQEITDRSSLLTKKTLGEIERGETNSKFETLLKLSKLLNVTLLELMDYDK